MCVPLGLVWSGSVKWDRQRALLYTHMALLVGSNVVPRYSQRHTRAQHAIVR